MKKQLIFLFLLCSLFAQAQTIEYSIYAPAPDSFFLVETVIGVSTRDVPKPGKSETSQLFRSEAQLLDYIQYLKNQANSARKQSETLVAEAEANAKKFVEEANAQSQKLKDAAPRLETAAGKIEAVAKANKSFFDGKPPDKKKKKRL